MSFAQQESWNFPELMVFPLRSEAQQNTWNHFNSIYLGPRDGIMCQNTPVNVSLSGAFHSAHQLHFNEGKQAICSLIAPHKHIMHANGDKYDYAVPL